MFETDTNLSECVTFLSCLVSFIGENACLKTIVEKYGFIRVAFRHLNMIML